MKYSGKLFLVILILISLQCFDTPESSKTVEGSVTQKQPREESTHSLVPKFSVDESASKLLACNWNFTLLENGAANVLLEIELNWTGNRDFFYFKLPRTMENKSSAHVKVEKLTLSSGSSVSLWKIQPELLSNSSGTITLEIYWSLASFFVQDRWCFPAYEYLPLYPDEHDILTEKMNATVNFPSSTRSESIDVDERSNEGFSVTRKGSLLSLHTNNPQSVRYRSMPEITYSGPLKPDNQEIITEIREFSVIIPSVFKSNAQEILFRIENVSQILRNWLKRSKLELKVPIFFFPLFKDVFGSTAGFFNGSIFLPGYVIFEFMDPLYDSEYSHSRGLELLSYFLTSIYTPWIGFPDFFRVGLAHLGEYYCLVELGLPISAAQFLAFNSNPYYYIDGRIWAWQWSDELKSSLGYPYHVAHEHSFYILYNLTRVTNTTTIFGEFFQKLESDQILFVNGLTSQDKWRIFVRYLSETAEMELFPFFQRWGLQVDLLTDIGIQYSYSCYWIAFIIGCAVLIYQRLQGFITTKQLLSLVPVAVYGMLPFLLRWSFLPSYAAGIMMVLFYSSFGVIIMIGITVGFPGIPIIYNPYLKKLGKLQALLSLEQQSFRSDRYILIVEGRDDVKIWSQFFLRYGIDPEQERISITNPGDKNGGGVAEVIKAGKLIKKLHLGIPFRIILDSDNEKVEREGMLKTERFSPMEYYILDRKDIESYLIDPRSISELSKRPINEIDHIINSTSGTGKIKLERIFKQINLTLDAGSKEILVRLMDKIPDEIVSFIEGVKITIRGE